MNRDARLPYAESHWVSLNAPRMTAEGARDAFAREFGHPLLDGTADAVHAVAFEWHRRPLRAGERPEDNDPMAWEEGEWLRSLMREGRPLSLVEARGLFCARFGWLMPWWLLRWFVRKEGLPWRRG